MAKKKINFELIHETHEAYAVLSAMREYHPDTRDADIGLAWQKWLKPDVDGHLILGKCVKLSDLHREFFKLDFIIIINRDTWDDPLFDRSKKEALMDHELCHAARAEDDEGPQWDERDRQVWRTRKHDVEEFQDIIVRHGTYKRDLERFAEALAKRRGAPLFEDDLGSTLASAKQAAGGTHARKRKDAGEAQVN